MKVTPTQLSAFTFLYAARSAYNTDPWVSVLILSTFFTSLVVHRQRPFFPNDINIFDWLDPGLARCWWCTAAYKTFQKKSFWSLLMILFVMGFAYLRLFYRHGSNIRYLIHVCMHLSATFGTLIIYY